MSNWKPQITVITRESIRESQNHYGSKSQYKHIRYATYKELKRNLKKHLEENVEDTVSVNRSRRGEWGEWFEHWALINGKPKIIKQGWM